MFSIISLLAKTKMAIQYIIALVKIVTILETIPKDKELTIKYPVITITMVATTGLIIDPIKENLTICLTK